MSYARYLKGDHWARFRLRYLQTHAAACVVCGSPTIQFHHMTYERLGHERFSDVMILCPAHHRDLHNRQKARKRPFLTSAAVVAALTAPRRKTSPRASRRP